mmetsp:Transcript_27542/g.67913  ORF Transcript_27542/g.67913 Transcript_27542/m.67913 type:complete len:364 (-) Transcript_27542:392-1483(-)
MVFVDLVLGAPQDWAVQATALRLRAALDATARRRQPRALAQLEELTTAPLRAEPPVRARVTAFAWGLRSLPSRREVSLEYGRALAGLGSLADSVRAFREAGAEEEAAIALSALGEKEQALAIVREALADPGSATPGLYCTLGDLTGDEEHFRSALQLAGGRHFRAALALGASATRRRAWAEAEEHLKIALLLRPHSAPVWLHLAMCMMQAEPPRESEAVDALRRALSLEPDDVQSWALLGSTLLEMPGREAEARSALGRASELLPTDPTLAGRHVRACCATNDLENAKKTIGRAHALGLTLPKSAIHRVYQALGGSGDGERSASATLSGSGALSADAQKLATAAALASERRLDNGDGADTLGR